MAESLTVNGTDLSALMTVMNVRGFMGNVVARGAEYEMPRRAGAVAGAYWAGPMAPLGVEGYLIGSARADYHDDARALAAVVWNDGETYTVTRVITRMSGGDLTAEATGRYLAGLDSIQQASDNLGRVAFDIALLDPNWWATSATTLSTITTTLTPTIVGDLATQRITLTFSGVTGTQRLTNSTTGEYVEITGSNSAATVLDCRDFTAIRSAASVAGSVTHSSSFESWLSLVPGSNSLALTGGGEVIVAYRAAWL
jgi:hypothetical protein